MTEIKLFQSKDNKADAVAGIRRDGVVILEQLFSETQMNELAKALNPGLEAQSPGGGEFFGNAKRSINAIFARGTTFSTTLLMNEQLLALADGILLPTVPMAAATPPPRTPGFLDPIDPGVGPNCHHYHLNASVAMQVCAGGTPQMLHRDEWRYRPWFQRDPEGPELTLAFMVAITDFTAENGATHFIPGSNQWPESRKPRQDEVTQAIMPQGSVAAWLGSVYHGLGVNRTPVPRTGVIFSYGVDRMMQEENQFMAVPPELAAELPPKARKLLGYHSSPALNYIDGLDDGHVLDNSAEHANG